MFKSFVLVSFCLVLASAEPNHLLNDSPLASSLNTCDIQSIKDLVSQVVSLTSDTATSVVSSGIAILVDLAFCLWPFDLYMCLESDMEYAILDNMKQIGVSLVDYILTLQPLLKEISDDIAACASV